MLIQVVTDNYVENSADLTSRVEAEVGGTLDRFGDRITRVEVHLSDENSDKKKGSEDMRCRLEAHVAGLKEISVTHYASSLDEALDGATDKLEKLLDRTLGRLNDHKGRTSFGGDQAI